MILQELFAMIGEKIKLSKEERAKFDELCASLEGVAPVKRWNSEKRKAQAEKMRDHWKAGRVEPVFEIYFRDSSPYEVVGFEKLAEEMGVSARSAKAYIYKGGGVHHFIDTNGVAGTATRISKGGFVRAANDPNPIFLFEVEGQKPCIKHGVTEASKFIGVIEGTLLNYMVAGRGVHNFKGRKVGRVIQITRSDIDLEALGVAGLVDKLLKTSKKS